MTQVVVLGHGGYAEGIKKNLNMLLGELKNFYFLDFMPNEDLETFKNHLVKLIEDENLKDILFVCDLNGGSPFREACILSLGNKNMQVVAGVNTAALSELSYMLDESPLDLAKQAVEITKDSVMTFLEEE